MCVCVLQLKVSVYVDILMIMRTPCAVNKYQETCLVVKSCCQEQRSTVDIAICILSDSEYDYFQYSYDSHVHGMKYEHTITCGHHDIMTSIAYEYCACILFLCSVFCHRVDLVLYVHWVELRTAFTLLVHFQV